MRKAILSIIPAVFLMNGDILAEELVTEIKSGEYCSSELFKQFKKTEQTSHERLRLKPSNKLLEFVTSMELMCPWESQRDYNGDKMPDWIGFVKKASEYQLIAYMSNSHVYSFQVISTLQNLPKSTFIQWLPASQLSNFTKDKLPINNLSYALQVSNLEKMTNFYLWDGRKMAKVLTTPQIF